MSQNEEKVNNKIVSSKQSFGLDLKIGLKKKTLQSKSKKEVFFSPQVGG